MTKYIYTSVNSYENKVKKPDPITKDSRGSEIKVGAKVAYNISGSVAMGIITTIKNNEWKKSDRGWKCSFAIEIENEDLHISTVKNPNSFIIL